jgi:Zn-dependent metalloprotease
MISTYETEHRCSIFCILPPHILVQIAKNGKTKQLRDLAVACLTRDHTLRTHRLTFSLLGGLQVAHAAVAAPAEPQKQRSIYDAGHNTNLPGALVRSEGQAPVADQSVNRAYDGLGDTFDFYLAAYQRNSIDNRGLPLVASVHYDQDYDNAFWNGQQMVFGDGDNQIFIDFTGSIDVIGHELTHGVTGSEANLTYLNQSGALNESISDVFGSLVKQYKLNQTADTADWLIGAGILAPGIQGRALRDMRSPGTAYNDPVLGQDPQPADMAHFVQTNEDNGGVHINSGIPNRAFYLVAAAIGGSAWVKAGQIWYDTVTDARLKPSADFAGFANLTVLNANHRFGSGSNESKAVIQAWNTVGVKIPSNLTAVA